MKLMKQMLQLKLFTSNSLTSSLYAFKIKPSRSNFRSNMKKPIILLLLVSSGILFAQQEFLVLCREGSFESVYNAINTGENINIVDEYGQTPLMYAATANTDPRIIKILVESGADVNAQSPEGWTALMYAVRENTNPEVVKTLLEVGAEVGLKNSDGQLALNYAGSNTALLNSETFRTLQERSLLALQRKFAEQMLTSLGARAVDCPQEVYTNMPGTPVCAYVNDDEEAFKAVWESSVNNQAIDVEVTAVNDWSVSNDVLLRAYLVADQRLGVVYNSGAIIMLLLFP